MLNKPSTKGLLTDGMKYKLIAVIEKDAKDRKRRVKAPLDLDLLEKLHEVCVQEIKDEDEVLPVLRRFLAVRYKMNLECVDDMLVRANLMEASTETGVLA